MLGSDLGDLLVVLDQLPVVAEDVRALPRHGALVDGALLRLELDRNPILLLDAPEVAL